MRRFLEFIVEHTLRFPGEPLKEVIIGSELYAAGKDFDPRLSAVVRVDATRLRTKLREYYESEGAADPLIIDLPKGSYTPVFHAAAAQNQPGAAGAQQRRGDTSIAVLPFSNLSPQPRDYFSDGLAEEIIHALSSVPGLRVVARTSAFAMKHKNADVREVGRALNVDFVLEGSVRQSGDALRITVQLVSTSDGYQLWSCRYDRRIEDVFAVQDDIAREIISMLRVSAANRPNALASDVPANFEAYALYLRGRHHLNRQTRDSFYRAIEYFDRALAQSPGYAAALSSKAAALFYLGMFAMEPPLQVMPKAREAAAQALESSERAGEALSVTACTRAMLEWDWAGAEALFHKSLAVQPGSELSEHLFAMFALLPLARIDEALARIERARQSDPLSTFVSASLAAVLLMARRNEQAEAECRRALELDANFWRPVVGLGRCFEAKGNYEGAIACFERAMLLSDHVPSAIGALGHAYGRVGDIERAHQLIRELDELARHRYVSPYGRVLIYLGLGDERMFEWLDRSYEERAGWLMYLATDPRFDRLRTNQRFRSFLQRLHLPLLTHPAAHA